MKQVMRAAAKATSNTMLSRTKAFTALPHLRFPTIALSLFAKRYTRFAWETIS